MTGIESKEEKHQLEYSIYSCRVSWCPICNQHFFNERNVSHTTVVTKQHYHTVTTALSSLPVQEGEKDEFIERQMVRINAKMDRNRKFIIASDAWDAGYARGFSEGADISELSIHPDKDSYLSNL